MKKALKKSNKTIYHYLDGERIEGAHKQISGNVSDIRGSVSDIRGNVSGIRGNLDDCGITDEDRAKGVNILDLVEK